MLARVKRRIGEILSQTVKRGGNYQGGSSAPLPRGVSPNDSSRFQSIAAIPDTLLKARGSQGKAELPHGEFAAMVQDDLGWHRSTAFMLMAVGRNSLLSNVDHGHLLPASWRTLYELTKLPDMEFWFGDLRFRSYWRLGDLSLEVDGGKGGRPKKTGPPLGQFR